MICLWGLWLSVCDRFFLSLPLPHVHELAVSMFVPLLTAKFGAFGYNAFYDVLILYALLDVLTDSLCFVKRKWFTSGEIRPASFWDDGGLRLVQQLIISAPFMC